MRGIKGKRGMWPRQICIYPMRKIQKPTRQKYSQCHKNNLTSDILYCPSYPLKTSTFLNNKLICSNSLFSKIFNTFNPKANMLSNGSKLSSSSRISKFFSILTLCDSPATACINTIFCTSAMAGCKRWSMSKERKKVNYG